MRLLLFASEFPPGPGGIGTHAHQLAKQLQKLDWDVLAVAPQDYAAEAEVTSFNATQSYRICRLVRRGGRGRTSLHRFRMVWQTFRNFAPDVAMASGARAVWLMPILALRFRLPWVAVGHGTEFGARGLLSRGVTRWAYQRAECLISVSHFTEQYIRRVGITPPSSRVIPNGADDGRFRILPHSSIENLRTTLPSGAGRVLVTVGHVTPRKGQETVIRALPRIVAACPDTHYFMIGLPAIKSQLQRLADELGVAEHVHFLGRLSGEQVVQWVNLCDVFVMTSTQTEDGDFEGYGIAVVEAALCGKPSVVSNDSGLVEAIVDGETGIAVPQGNPTATADAILSLIGASSDERRQRMGAAARARAAAEQTWTLRARQYDALLREIVAAAPECRETIEVDVRNTAT